MGTALGEFMNDNLRAELIRRILDADTTLPDGPYPEEQAGWILDALGFEEEVQWVPVSESKEEWGPGSLEDAKIRLRTYPPGWNYFGDSEEDSSLGLTHAYAEYRVVLPWFKTGEEFRD